MQLLLIILIVAVTAILLLHYGVLLSTKFEFARRTLLGLAAGCSYVFLLFALAWNGFAPSSTFGWFVMASAITFAFIAPLAYWLPVATIWLYPLAFTLPALLIGLLAITGGIPAPIIIGVFTFLAGLVAAFFGRKLAGIYRSSSDPEPSETRSLR